ncbi:hypothetical protein HYDPIDRAFT_28095 [Hydnomerulius pinastri MD-312]|uniref:Uncharacterized protein n=1 Tax=Hydnomerulius pinastri MD-312 TaxID=994086 RepID=A0A0C9WA40_9AGAM|nr:hypothetical protein HYDPIDRAFT_28095 [Hydnomerulius pinastri MD-312]
MPSVDPVRETMLMPSRFASGTFPISKGYNLRQMLYSHPSARDGDGPGLSASEEIIPAFPFNDAPIYADTLHLETLAFHNFWGCLLTPENVASLIQTDDIRYHVWVAAKRVIESRRIDVTNEEGLVAAVLEQFLVEVTLALLDLCPGPVLVFIDPRLHDDADAMVARARSMIAKFDAANIRRWRVVVTLPATEDGIHAAAELNEHAIQTNLSLVSCLPHASACIEAGARLLTMSVGPILEWFEQQDKITPRVSSTSSNHPGIEVIQSCATYIHRHRLNTSIVTTEMRTWSELKQLNGIGGAALSKNHLDQIPKQKLATWYPRPDDTSGATMRSREAEYPSRYLDSKQGFLASLPAQCRSLVSAVLYVRLGKMKVHMEDIALVVRDEVRRRVELETMDLDCLYRRPAQQVTKPKKTSSSKRSKSSARSKPPLGQAEEPAPLIEGVEYF